MKSSFQDMFFKTKPFVEITNIARFKMLYTIQCTVQDKNDREIMKRAVLEYIYFSRVISYINSKFHCSTIFQKVTFECLKNCIKMDNLPLEALLNFNIFLHVRYNLFLRRPNQFEGDFKF